MAGGSLRMQSLDAAGACEVLDSFCKGRKVSCSRDTNEADAPILLRMKAMSQGSRFRHETLRMDKTKNCLQLHCTGCQHW